MEDQGYTRRMVSPGLESAGEVGSVVQLHFQYLISQSCSSILEHILPGGR
jgi:hypothetical protein